MRQQDPLRALREDERSVLQHVSRASREPAAVVARAKALLAVAAGASYSAAAQAAGRRSGDAIGRLVARFNREGLVALVPGHGGGQPARSTSAERERILSEARRPPEHERDGTATWSLTTVQRALRRAPDGLPQMGCPRGARTPSGACCTTPAGTGSAPAPGARPARPCACASGAGCSCTTPTPTQKRADRAGVP
jgi:transposase